MATKPTDQRQLQLESMAGRSKFNKARRENAGFMEKLKGFAAAANGWLQAFFPMRVYNHFSRQAGNVLAAGIAFVMFFSAIAALTAAFTVFAFLFENNKELQNTVVSGINEAAPGLVKTPQNRDGLFDPQNSLPGNRALSITFIITLVTTILSALNMLVNIRLGVRRIFEKAPPTTSFLVQKGKDLGFGVLIALLVISSTVLNAVASAVMGWVFDLLGLDSALLYWLAKIVSYAITFALNVAAMMVIVRLVSELKVPFKPLLQGSLVGGAGLSLISALGTSVVSGSVTKYPALSAFLVPAILLVWFNLLFTVVLIGASWCYLSWNDARTRQSHDKAPVEVAKEKAAHPKDHRSRRVAGAAVRPAHE